MRKFVSYFLVCFLSAIILSCGEKGDMRLSGEVSNLNSPYIFAVYVSGDSLKIDTIKAKDNGKFVYLNHIDTLVSFTLYFNDYASSSVFWADKNQKITLKGDVKLADLIEIEGNKINEYLTLFKQENKDLLTQRGRLLEDFERSKKEDNPLFNNEKIAQINSLNYELTLKAEEFIKNNPDKTSSLILINDFFFNSENPKALSRVLTYLKGDAATSPMAETLRAFSEKINRSDEGAHFPFFNLTDVKDKAVRSSDFDGKYLLLSFVSSSGNESRESQKILKSIYPKLDKDSAAFVSVYIDTDIYPVSYMKRDSIPWITVPEKRSWASEIVDAYNIQYVPYNILISPNGIIKERNIPSHDVLNAIKKPASTN